MEILLKDESRIVEYKEKLPIDNNKWLKTVVSFSNTSGGNIIVGVQDETLEIVGIDESRSKLESRIADTIFNNIIPNPNINIVFQNVGDKDILVLSVARGSETPYYIKNLGRELGTYVRFGSTDRKATSSQIFELTMSSERRSFASELFKPNNIAKELEEKEILKFIDEINKYNTGRDISINKLLEWQLIEKNFEKYFATKGYMLLTNNPFNYSYIQIGVFDGINKSNLIHDERIGGSIIDQYNRTIDSLLDILSKGYLFKRVRKKEYQIPEEVIREIVANAIVHRSYIDEHPIRIEVYENRLQIYSPGTLYDGIQLKDILVGMSKLRNKNIAEMFYHLGYIEKWGSGIQRSNQILLDNGYNQLQIDVENIHGVTVTIEFGNSVKSDVKKSAPFNKGKIPSLDDVLDRYRINPGEFTRSQIKEDFNLSDHYARIISEELVEKKLVTKVGKGPATRYKIKQNLQD